MRDDGTPAGLTPRAPGRPVPAAVLQRWRALAGSRLRRRLPLLLRLLVAGGLIFYLGLRLDLRAAWHELAAAGLGACVAAVAVSVAQTAVLAWRWQRILAAQRIQLGFGQVARLVFIGAFFNQWLPTSVGGDAVRLVMLHAAGPSLRQATQAVLVDRLSGVAALMLLILPGLPGVAALSAGDASFLFGACALTVVFGAVLAAYFMADGVIERFPRLARLRLVRIIAETSASARFVTWRAPTAPATLLLAVAVHLSTVGVVCLLAGALHAGLSPLLGFVLVPPIIAAALLPVSVGGWGTREVAMVAGLGLAGVPPPTALAISVLLGLVGLIAALPGGVLWLLNRGTRPVAAAE